MNPEPKVKGNLVYLIKKYMKQNFGQDKFSQILSKLPSADAELFDNAIISHKWYPEKSLANILRAGVIVLGETNMKIFSRKLAKEQLSSFYKFILKFFVTPKKLAENNYRLWDSLHDTGKLTTLKISDKFNEIKITDFDFINREYEMLFVEYYCGVFEILGCNNPKGKCIKTSKNNYKIVFVWE